MIISVVSVTINNPLVSFITVFFMVGRKEMKERKDQTKR